MRPAYILKQNQNITKQKDSIVDNNKKKKKNDYCTNEHTKKKK